MVEAARRRRAATFGLIVPCLVLVCSDAAYNPCGLREGSVYVQGKCFTLVEETLTWMEAQAYCHSNIFGGKLAEPETQEEFDAIATVNNTLSWYLGGTDAFANGRFAWASSFREIPQPVEEDKSVGAGNQCLLREPEGLRGHSCRTRANFVCENYVGNPCDVILPGAQFLAGRCFLFLPQQMGAYEAEEACEEKGAFLAELTTADLAQEVTSYGLRLLMQTLPSAGKSVWVGANNLTGVWLWKTSGRPVVSSLWKDKQPDLVSETHAVIGLKSQAMLNRLARRRNFPLCQRDVINPCDGQPLGGHFMLDRCYKYFDQEVTWRAAQEICESQDATLVEPSSRVVIDNLLNFLSSKQGSQTWMSIPSYSAGQPDWCSSLDPTRHYRISVTSGKAVMSEADDTSTFVCEKRVVKWSKLQYIAVLPSTPDRPLPIDLQGQLTVTSSLLERDVYLRIVTQGVQTPNPLHEVRTAVSPGSAFVRQLTGMFSASDPGQPSRSMVVEASDPVSVTLFLTADAHVTSCLLLPAPRDTSDLVTSYYVIPAFPAANATGQLAVASLHDGVTDVTVHRPRDDGSLPPHTTVRLTHQYHSHLLGDHHDVTLSGQVVQSHRPVAVFLSTTSTFGPGPVQGGYSLKQAWPAEYPGREYVVFPSLPTGGDLVDVLEIVALYDDTTISIVFPLQAEVTYRYLTCRGDSLRVNIRNEGFFLLRGNLPFYASKLTSSWESLWFPDTASSEEEGYLPLCAVSLVSQSAWRDQYVFTWTPVLLTYDVYLVLVVGRGLADQVKLEPAVVPPTCTTVAGSAEWAGCYFMLPREEQTYRLNTGAEKSKMAAYMYARGPAHCLSHALGVQEQPKLSAQMYDDLRSPLTTSCTPPPPLEITTTVTTREPDETNPTTDTLTTPTIEETTSQQAQTTDVTTSQDEGTDQPLLEESRDDSLKNMTSEQVEELLEEIVHVLKVEKTGTSSYKRRKSSADDKRVSAKTMGYSGSIIIIVFVSLILSPDVISVVAFLIRRFRACIKPREPKTEIIYI